MYHLIDLFNRRVLSSHRSHPAAEAAEVKYRRAVQRANGAGSYIPTCISNGRRAVVDDILDRATSHGWSRGELAAAIQKL